MSNLNHKGFSAVEGLLSIIAVAIIVFVGYYVWHTQSQTNKTLNSATQVANSSPAEGSTKSSSKSSSSATKYFTITQWGVRAPYSGNLTLEYAVDTSGSLQYASFSSTQLDNSDPNCKVDLSQGGSYGGAIARQLATDEYDYPGDGSDSGMTVAQYAATLKSSDYGHVGNYYFFYTSPQAACGSSQSSEQLQTETNSVVQDLTAGLQAIPQ